MSRGFKDRTGERRLMTCGLVAEIIEYRNSNDMDVKFENGNIRYNVTYASFKKGNIRDIKMKLLDDRVGEKGINNQGLKMVIIAYRSAIDMDIKFENGYIAKGVYYRSFIDGKVYNPYNPTVCGVGYLGNSKSIEDKKTKRSYRIWEGMIRRCYCEEIFSHHPNYRGCEVCDDWKCYSNFEKWYDEHYYTLDNEKVELDKDILIDGNKIYSPETCIFVPQYINQLFSGNSKKTDLPFGINYRKDIDKYCTSIKINGKKYFLGNFDTVEEAEKTYIKARKERLSIIAEQYKEVIPQKLYDRLIEISNS